VEKDPVRYERAVLRWLVRYLSEGKPTLLDTHLALSALGELRAGDARARELLVELFDTHASGYSHGFWFL
jgi:hypothetical protein